jgi:putative membrane protein
MMQAVLDSFVAGFPILMMHSSVTIAMLVAGVLLYIWITPWDEMALIRAGNTAAAISLGGAIIGLAIPLAFAMAASVSVYEILIWGLVTLLLQIIAFRVADLLLRDLPTRIEAGEIGAATLLVSIKLAVAAVNAAAVSG